MIFKVGVGCDLSLTFGVLIGFFTADSSGVY